jgi:hypothetical protein
VTETGVPGSSESGNTDWLSVFSGVNTIDFATNLLKVSSSPMLVGVATSPMADTPYSVPAAYDVAESELPGGPLGV